MQKRIYKVATPNGVRLVNAANPSQAVRHVSKSEIGCSIPTQHELVALLTVDNVKVEEASLNQEQESLLDSAGQFTFNPASVATAE